MAFKTSKTALHFNVTDMWTDISLRDLMSNGAKNPLGTAPSHNMSPIIKQSAIHFLLI